MMLKKHLAITAVLVIIAATISKLGAIIAPSLLSTLFTVNGIMFSIGLGLISNFNLRGIRNRSYVSSIRADINAVRNIFMLLFSFSAISFVASLLVALPITVMVYEIWFTLDLSVLSILIIVYATAYFIVNFLSIQRLNDEIFDRLLDEEK